MLLFCTIVHNPFFHRFMVNLFIIIDTTWCSLYMIQRVVAFKTLQLSVKFFCTSGAITVPTACGTYRIIHVRNIVYL